jgi:hypothetical protein
MMPGEENGTQNESAADSAATPQRHIISPDHLIAGVGVAKTPFETGRSSVMKRLGGEMASKPAVNPGQLKRRAWAKIVGTCQVDGCAHGMGDVGLWDYVLV